MDQPRAYIICTSPRSGSTLLCHLLRATGVAGYPQSHFHRPDLQDWLNSYGLDRGGYDTHLDALRAALSAGIARGKGQGDLFALRLQRHSFPYFMNQLGLLFPDLPNDRARIETAFGRCQFIHLTRENKLDQAISYVKADQTGLWHKGPDGREIERLAPPADPVYDASAITTQYDEFIQMDRAWRLWFDAQNIQPLRITYDALSADPFGVRAQVLDVLGVTYAAPVDEIPPVAKLADATNAEWARRYLEQRKTER